jgi:hypothetical protein
VDDRLDARRELVGGGARRLRGRVARQRQRLAVGVAGRGDSGPVDGLQRPQHLQDRSSPASDCRPRDHRRSSVAAVREPDPDARDGARRLIAARRDGHRAGRAVEDAVGDAPGEDAADAPAVRGADDEQARAEITDRTVKRAGHRPASRRQCLSALGQQLQRTRKRCLGTVAHQRVVARRNEPGRKLVQRMHGDRDYPGAGQLAECRREGERCRVLSHGVHTDDDGTVHGSLLVLVRTPCWIRSVRSTSVARRANHAASDGLITSGRADAGAMIPRPLPAS